MHAAVSSAPRHRQLWSGEWIAFVWSSVPGALLATVAIPLVGEQIALAIFALSFVGLNLMHMGATWARVYVHPSWRARPVERLLIPVGLAAFALGYEAIGGGALLLAAQYFLSFHHAIMQNYGLLRVSQRRTSRQVDPRLDMAACLLLPGAALLYRADAVCGQYSGAPLPSVPVELLVVLALAGVVALGAFAVREWRSHRAGATVDPIGIGLVFGTNLIWSALLVFNAHPALPLYALASGHYAQYLYFVYHVEQRDRSPLPTVTATRLVAAMKRSGPAYLLVLLGIAGVVTTGLTLASMGLREVATMLHLRPADALDLAPWAAAMIGVNLEHYWLDHRIWRAPRTAAVPAPAAGVATA